MRHQPKHSGGRSRPAGSVIVNSSQDYQVRSCLKSGGGRKEGRKKETAAGWCLLIVPSLWEAEAFETSSGYMMRPYLKETEQTPALQVWLSSVVESLHSMKEALV